MMIKMKKQTYTKPEIKIYYLDIEELMDNLQNASKEAQRGDEENPDAFSQPSTWDEDNWKI